MVGAIHIAGTLSSFEAPTSKCARDGSGTVTALLTSRPVLPLTAVSPTLADATDASDGILDPTHLSGPPPHPMDNVHQLAKVRVASSSPLV
jgi:hypothetical protein